MCSNRLYHSSSGGSDQRARRGRSSGNYDVIARALAAAGGDQSNKALGNIRKIKLKSDRRRGVFDVTTATTERHSRRPVSVWS